MTYKQILGQNFVNIIKDKPVSLNHVIHPTALTKLLINHNLSTPTFFCSKRHYQLHRCVTPPLLILHVSHHRHSHDHLSHHFHFITCHIIINHITCHMTGTYSTSLVTPTITTPVTCHTTATQMTHSHLITCHTIATSSLLT